MKRILIGLMLIAASVLAIAPARAQALDECPHAATIAALHACVQHAADHGVIDTPGLATSLHRKLDGAQAALERNQARVASNILEAVVHEVDAQSGRHIAAEHAQHFVMHVELVIGALTAA